MTDHGRAAMAILLLLATCASIARALVPRNALSPPHPETKCEVPVEEMDGIHCFDRPIAIARDLHPGDKVLADGKKARIAPARVELFAIPIDLNHASPEELASLPGIGPGLAKTIAAARPFSSVDALIELPGIGEKRLGKLRERLYLGE
jgi:DNA uptake protein ComE-like DNA-binding protein